MPEVSGWQVILGLKIAVVAVTAILITSLIALWLGKYRLHGRINLAFFLLTLCWCDAASAGFCDFSFAGAGFFFPTLLSASLNVAPDRSVACEFFLEFTPAPIAIGLGAAAGIKRDMSASYSWSHARDRHESTHTIALVTFASPLKSRRPKPMTTLPTMRE